MRVLKAMLCLFLAACAWSLLVSVLLAYYFAYSPAFDIAVSSYRAEVLSWEAARRVLLIHDLVVHVAFAMLAYPPAILLQWVFHTAGLWWAVASLAAGPVLIWGEYACGSLLNVLRAPESMQNWAIAFGYILLVASLPACYLLADHRRRGTGKSHDAPDNRLQRTLD